MVEEEELTATIFAADITSAWVEADRSVEGVADTGSAWTTRAISGLQSRDMVERVREGTFLGGIDDEGMKNQEEQHVRSHDVARMSGWLVNRRCGKEMLDSA